MSNLQAKVIDITRSFLVTDPNAFPNNQGWTGGEDTPEQEPPITAYEGYNFLPTPYGYRSFFGTSSTLNVGALPPRCDRVLIYQFGTYENILIALCEDGIWTCRPNVAATAWVHAIVMIVPTVGTYKEFTYAVVTNNLYIFREGQTTINYITPTSIAPITGVVTWALLTPLFLNMAGQIGMFRANGRLGFWDSSNSISWSDVANLADFTPSLTTLAGNAVFNGVTGRVITIKSQGDGFVIYTTRGIVGVHYLPAGVSLWESSVISDSAGIWYDHEVCTGMNEMEQYVFSNAGIKRIGSYNALNKSHTMEDIVPDVYDLLKESRQPVYLDFINGRFLAFSLIDASYISAKVSFVYNTIGAISVRILIGGVPWNGVTALPTLIGGISTGQSIANSINAQNAFLGSVVGSRFGVAAKWNSTFGGDLGYFEVGIAGIGQSHSSLAADELAQVAAWQVAAVARQNARTAALATPPTVTGAIQHSGPHFTLADANIALAAAVAAWTPNTLLETLGTFVYGNPVVTGPTMTGAGTYHATVAMSMVCSGASKVDRVRNRVYSIRSAVNTPAHGMTYTYFAAPNSQPAIQGTAYGLTYNSCLATLQGIIPGVWLGFGGWFFWPAPNQFAPRYTAYDTPGPLTMTVYYIDYVETVSTISAADPLTVTGNYSASQTCMDWGFIDYQYTMGAFTSSLGAMVITGTTSTGPSLLPLDTNVFYPGATFLLQDGVPAPIYPTFTGALVYDTSLKKWGKMKASYRCLIDYSPINTMNGSLNYTNFGMDLGMLQPTTGIINTFDARPADSWMRWGKIGLYRKGVTQIQEVRMHFRTSSSGSVIVDSSLDGRALEFSLPKTGVFSLAGSTSFNPNSTGQWHTVTLSGQFDLQYLEVRCNIAGRR